MSRKTLLLLAVLAMPLAVVGGLSRLRPAVAAVGSASSQCTPQDADTATCSLTLSGALGPGETVTVAISGGTLDQVSYAGGCQPTAARNPPAIASSASFTFTAPDGGCVGPVVFSETVSGLGGSTALVQSVTDSGAPGAVVNTAVFLVGFSGSASCTAAGTPGAFACQLSVNASENLTDATISVALSNGALTGATFVSGCLAPPSLSVSATGFSFTTPAGGCGGFGPLIVSETVAGVSESSLTQTVSASGGFSGMGSISAALPAPAGGAVTMTGTKLCSRGDNADDDDNNGDDLAYADDNQGAGANCALTVQPSAPLAAGAIVTVQIGGNAVFSSVSYDGGCVGTPSVSVGGASFSFVVPGGDCAGPLVFSEGLSVSGAGGGPLAQTVTVAGASSGAATIVATRRDGSAFTLPSTQTGNGGGNDNGNGNGTGRGNGNGGGNGNGDNHPVPACQNSHGRAQQHNPHCQGDNERSGLGGTTIGRWPANR